MIRVFGSLGIGPIYLFSAADSNVRSHFEEEEEEESEARSWRRREEGQGETADDLNYCSCGRVGVRTQ